MKRVLVALDTSDEASFVLDRALDLARTVNGQVRLLRVIPERVGPAAPNLFEPAGDTNARLAEAEAALRLVEEDVPERFRDGVVVEVGPPAQAICRAARSYGADLVVIGAHRHGLIDRVLGTTAAGVVNQIDRPVLVARRSPVARVEQAKVVPSDDGVPPESFPLFETSAVAGTLTGIMAGAIAGPPGAVIGGTIGLAAGMLAGAALETDGQQAAAHERELDTSIGVIDGDVGAREAARKGIEAYTRSLRTGTEPALPEIGGVGLALRDEHARLDQAYEAFLRAYREGGWPEVDAQWLAFEPLIRGHIAREEERVLPILESIAPAPTEELRREHAELLRLLDAIGVGIELHAFPHTDAEELVRRLRAHATREESLLYPWVDTLANVATPAKQSAA